MQVTLEIPDTYAVELTAAGKDPARAALEALALEGYRGGSLTETEVRRLLGLYTRMEVHEFRAAHHVPLHYTSAHLQLDIAASDKLHSQRECAPAHAG
jgi:hypothetical protein